MLAAPTSDDDELQGSRGENLPPCTGHQASVAQAHGDTVLRVGDYAMQEEDHPWFGQYGVPREQHRPVHPVGAEGRSQRVPARGETMLLEAGRVQHAPMGVVDLTDWTSWRQGLGHLFERLPDNEEEVALVARGFAYREG